MSDVRKRAATGVAERLLGILGEPEEQMDLAEAALWIAWHEYPELPVDDYLARLDEYALQVRSGLPEDAGPLDMLARLNEYFFEQLEFRGDRDSYYDPRNSYLNQVLDRRCGIPISLSILYIEVGKRVGLPLRGVSFPGHFLVKLPHQGGDIVLDPFSGGVSLGIENLETLLRHSGMEPPERPAEIAMLLDAASGKSILARMLRNLKAIYRNAGQAEKLLDVLNLLLAVAPDELGELRERAVLYEQQECYASALADLQRLVRLEPQAGDDEELRQRLIDLQRKAGPLH